MSPLPPAGTPHAAYLAAVLAVRREREQVRLAPTPEAPRSEREPRPLAPAFPPAEPPAAPAGFVPPA